MGNFLFWGARDRAAMMRTVFASHAPDIAFYDANDQPDPSSVRYLATWQPPDDFGATYPNLELLFSTGAGVDQFDLAALPQSVKLIRLIDAHLTDGMVDYCTAAVMSLHRDFFQYQRAQREACWQEQTVLPATQRRVSILGAGELSRAVIKALRSFGFQLAAWSRSERVIEGAAHYSGPQALEAMLGNTDILICLLPLTAETAGMLNAALFAMLPTGAALVNVGRGGHVIDADLIDALDSGRLSQAILDVASSEPLRPGHPFWAHPRILLTPHIASVTDPVAASKAIIANIRRHRAGEPLVGLVERANGY